jgi:hypothetical protein
MRGRRPRTSTIVLTGLFLAVLALYILVRPVPPAAGEAGSAASPASPPSPAPSAPGPRAVTKPVSYPEPEPFAQAG